ncbi:hypothetical protein Tco_0653221 [Tanacetum coccineum]|uniref:Uncharacterized protein n=1 Tax=Tanacetum coccineum TaxID=301880 RepID=A0ABQ4WZY7_9ASTR
MPFGLCMHQAHSKVVMVGIFHDMSEKKRWKLFMDDFSVFGRKAMFLELKSQVGNEVDRAKIGTLSLNSLPGMDIQGKGAKESKYKQIQARCGITPSRVILFGDIPTVIPSTSMVPLETSTIAHVISFVAPLVETTLVASPTGLCGLGPYSDSDSDSPDEMSSSEHISPLPTISPFLCTDSSETPDSSDGPPSQDPYVMILNGPRKLLTARKRVGPLPARRLAWRRASPRSSDHYSSSSSSSSDSSPVHSSEEYEADTSAGDTVKVGTDSMSAPIVEEEIIEPTGEDSFDSFGTRDGIVRSFKDMPIDLNDAMHDFYHHMSKVRIDMIIEIKTIQRWLEADQSIAWGQRVSMISED